MRHVPDVGEREMTESFRGEYARKLWFKSTGPDLAHGQGGGYCEP